MDCTDIVIIVVFFEGSYLICCLSNTNHKKIAQIFKKLTNSSLLFCMISFVVWWNAEGLSSVSFYQSVEPWQQLVHNFRIDEFRVPGTCFNCTPHTWHSAYFTIYQPVDSYPLTDGRSSSVRDSASVARGPDDGPGSGYGTGIPLGPVGSPR